MAKALERIVPRNFCLFGFNLNPGSFNLKEHVLISIIAAAGGAGAYGMDNVIVQRAGIFMGNRAIGLGESMLWIFSTQFIGYICRRQTI